MSVSGASDLSDPHLSYKFLFLLCVVLSFFEKKEKEKKVEESDVSVYLADNSKFKRMICAI